jgi:hypothetical protein
VECGGKKTATTLHQAMASEIDQLLGRVFAQRRKNGRTDLKAVETAGRQGQVDGQPAHRREVKLGCVFTQARWDQQGYPIREPGFDDLYRRHRDGRGVRQTPFPGSLETGLELRPEGSKEGMRDGAEWIWNLAAEHFPGAIQIVGIYHARQHLGHSPSPGVFVQKFHSFRNPSK